MKRMGSYICIGLLTVALSCTTELESRLSTSSSSNEEEREVVELTVRVTKEQTRATDTSLEDEIKSVQVFIFSDGVLEAAGYSDSDRVTLRCFSGCKNILAVANYSELEWSYGIKPASIEETVVELSEEKSWNVMYGNEEDVYVMPENAESLSTITVKRVGARIAIHKVTNNFRTTPPYVFTILRAYITNVVGDAQLYSATVPSYNYSPSVWYNKMGNEEELPSILSSEPMEVLLEYGESAELEQYFYCYPNYTESDIVRRPSTSKEWTPRFTRLIVETCCNDLINYYLVSLDGVQSGCSYEVEELSVGYYGAADPEGFMEYAEQDRSVSGVVAAVKSEVGDALEVDGVVTGDERANSCGEDCEWVPITGGSVKLIKYSL